MPRIVDHHGNILSKDGAKGEIQIFSLTAMKGYLNSPTATTEAFTDDRWIRSGDIGYVKGENWYVIDRTKDLIKVRGWQVSPAEIETALLEHVHIIDAGVIGVPSKDECGEVPPAFVVCVKDSKVEEEEVKSFLTTKLAKYKMVGGVVFVNSIPRNPTGKILRRVLRDAGDPERHRRNSKAAMEYTSALKDLDMYRNSEKSSSEVPGIKKDEIKFLMKEKPRGKKRKCCTTPAAFAC